MTEQWTAKWPYIANGLLQIVQNHGEKSYFRIGFRWGYRPNRLPRDPPLMQMETRKQWKECSTKTWRL